MITSSQARLIINDHVRAFIALQTKPLKVEFANDASFSPPRDENWCRVTVQYGDTIPSGLHNGILQRDVGIINIQCFTPKGHGDLSVIALADAWRAHFKGFRKPFFEVTLRHAPTDVTSEVSDAYAMSLVRIDFRVN